MLEIVDHAGLPQSDLVELRGELAEIRTLEDVVTWIPPASDLVEVVTQDEYTHDVIVWWRDAVYLVFDAT